MDILRSVSRSRQTRPLSEAIRIATVYCALFFLFGIHLPYWPVWLQSRHATPAEVGLLLGVALWARAVLNPIVGRWADRSQRSAAIARGLALATAASYVAFNFVEGFGPLLVASIVLGLSIAPFNPLVDGLAVASAAAGRVDYGRVRRWGSLAFVIASFGGGLMLEGRSDDAILWVLIAAALLLAVSSVLLPSPPRPAALRPGERAAGSITELLRRPGVALMLAAAGALQSSHAVLYAFGTSDWRARGLGDGVIGALWGESVIAEVILFSFGARVVGRLTPAGLLVVAGVGGLLRWPATAATASVGWLVLIQLLHAASFAALHLGSMTWIRDHVPAAAINRATTMYTAVASGLALGVGLPIAGMLYEEYGSNAYRFMAIASGVGTVLAVLLLQRDRIRAHAVAAAESLSRSRG
jgi:PPP family 3-phenylpropionic acid transporter